MLSGPIVYQGIQVIKDLTDSLIMQAKGSLESQSMIIINSKLSHKTFQNNIIENEQNFLERKTNLLKEGCLKFLREILMRIVNLTSQNNKITKLISNQSHLIKPKKLN